MPSKLTFALSTLLFALPACPAAITFAGSITSVTSNSLNPFNVVANIPKFNPALGTLQSVQLSAQLIVTSTALLFDVGPPALFPQPDVLSYNFQSTSTFVSIGGVPALIIPAVTSTSLPTVVNTPTTFLAQAPPSVENPNGSRLPAAVVPVIIGTGSLASTFAFTPTFTSLSPYATVISTTTTVQGVIFANFTFDPPANPVPVPEPASASLLLLAGGLAAAGARRR